MGLLTFIRRITRRDRNANEMAERAEELPPLSFPAVETPPQKAAGAAVPVSDKLEWIRSEDPIYYVYVHRDSEDRIFYVGMGHDDWAWAPKSGTWKQYVDERSGGKFEVEIIAEDLYISDAATKKDALLRKHARTIVNRQNPHRETDFKKLEKFHALRNANRAFVEATRKDIEGIDTEKAISLYRVALERMHEYAGMQLESGLIGELDGAQAYTDIVILDRLTVCLKRLRRFQELIETSNVYFSRYPADTKSSAGKTILKRVEAAKKKL